MTGSHASWATGFQQHSRHKIEILSMTGRHWKWRMHGAAITLAKRFAGQGKSYDLLLTTDMLDLSTFLGLCRKQLNNTPVAVYFHENQLSYPWSPQDRDVKKGRDFHYGFINWTTALSADKIFFNSMYNRDSFYIEVRRMLKAMPDSRHLNEVDTAIEKSVLLPLGIDLKQFMVPFEQKELTIPVILWNHRWEYDKNPVDFFKVLKRLKNNGVTFKLIVCGEGYEKYPVIFDTLSRDFSDELIHLGYAESKDEYRELLRKANIIPVTNKQEFFGQSLMEALVAGCFPLLPNALAYPEHVPGSLQKPMLYDTVDELYQKLTDVCQDLSTVADFTIAMQEVAMQYDWNTLIQSYDEAMESLIS